MHMPANWLLPMFVVCACSSVPQYEDRPQPTVVTAFEDAKFVPVDPGRSDSPQIAVLWGEPSTGPSAMLIRVKKVTLPMHTHSSAYHLLVLQGASKHWNADQTETAVKPLGPGSYWFQPGNEPHADACLSDECVWYLVWAGKRDGKLAEPRKR